MPDAPPHAAAPPLIDEELYGHMKAVAANLMKGESAAHTLQATALVNEAYLRLRADRQVHFRDEAPFFHAAAEAMRRVLVDHARRHLSLKRGGGRDGGSKHRARRVSLDVAELAAAADHDQMIDLDDALTELTADDARCGSVARLRLFGGLEVAEVAEVMDVSERTVAREWSFARSWLRDRLGDLAGGGDG